MPTAAEAKARTTVKRLQVQEAQAGYILIMVTKLNVLKVCVLVLLEPKKNVFYNSYILWSRCCCRPRNLA